METAHKDQHIASFVHICIVIVKRRGTTQTAVDFAEDLDVGRGVEILGSHTERILTLLARASMSPPRQRLLHGVIMN